MKNKFKVLPFAVLSTGILSVYAYGELNETYAKEGEVAIQMMGINDLHGQLEGTGSVYEYGTRLKERGGSAPLLSGYLDKTEKEFKDNKAEDAVSTRVQAGDMVGASPAVSGILQDEPTIKALNEMKFEVGTLGNHEFDEGLAEYNRILKGEAPEKGKFNKAVESYPREASNMEIVVANVVDKQTQKTPFDWKPYTIKTYTDSEGETAKIGYIGVVTSEIPNLILKKHWEQYDILDPATTINKYSKELRTKGVNAIVVLAHEAATSPSNNATEIGDAIKRIIDSLDSDSSVDVIFAGHNHVIANGTYKGIRVVEGASQGKAISNVIGIYDTNTNDFKEVTAEIVKVLDNGTVTPNEKLVELAKDANERIKEILLEELAKSENTIERVPSNSSDLKANLESPLGNLITDGQLWAARQAGYNQASFAITNQGGIRSDLEVKDGVITWGAAQKVQPFGNVMQVINIKGKDLIAALNSQYNSEEKYLLQISGIMYTYKEAPDGTVDAKGNPIKWVVDKAWVVKENGTKELIQDDKEYTGIINDFLYGGGDDFPEFTKSTLIGALDPDTEIFVNYLKHLSNIKAPELGRKVYYKDYKEPTHPNNNNQNPSVNPGNNNNNNNNSENNNNSNNNEEDVNNVDTNINSANNDGDDNKLQTNDNKKLPNTGIETSKTTTLVGATLLLIAALRMRKYKK